MSNVVTVHTGHPDRAQQRQILRRFIQITLGRLDRIRLDLSEQQQLFLDALPVMLHSNHADFPCYVSDYTPSGICKYQPSGAEIQKIHALATNFRLDDAKDNRQQLLGLYLTGDCGTIIEAKQQNIIVWLCHADNLAANEISQLHRKCGLIEEWAKSLNLRVRFRVFDSQFNVSQEKCKLHYLELDLFYRTAVLVAGRIPLWWLIPPEQEHRYEQYASILRHKSFVNDEDVIDFGGVQDIPAQEYICSGIDLLSDIEKQPYEICLKQAVSEIYINEQPDTLLLSRQYKYAVYNNKLDLDAVDPYVMVYRRIEAYLQARNESNRLELIRRCFYFQVGKKLSVHSSQPTWQRQLMEQFTQEWGWKKDKLKLLDNRRAWRAEQVKRECLELVRELTNSYRFLSEFARRNRQELSFLLGDMHILGRKLHSWYERKAGKVDRINLGLSENLLEDNLYFCQVKHRLQTVWAVYAEPISQRDSLSTVPMRRHESLVELMAWCHINGICDGKTRLNVVEGEHQLTTAELQNMRSIIQQKLPLNSKLLKPDNAKFNQAARPTSVQIFVNVGLDPTHKSHSQDKRILSLTTAFDYRDTSNNIVLNLETLTTNSWGEVICKTYRGSIALLNCIRDYMQSVPPASAISPPKPDVYCFAGKQAKVIKARIDELFRDLLACYYTATLPANTRYILQMKNQFFIIQYANNRTSFKGARSLPDLVRRLGQAQAQYSPILFDRHALSNSALAAICPTMNKGSLQIYCQDNGNQTATVYIIDEKGSIYSRIYPFTDVQNVLKPIDTFLQSTLYRQSASENLENQSSHMDYHYIETDVLYYEIQPSKASHEPPKILPVKLQNHLPSHRHFNVQAIAEAGPNNKPIFNIYCDQQEFSAVDWGDGLYPAIARFIMSRRKSAETYPCYISDLDLSSVGASDGSNSPQTIDYLRYKEEIENGINDALVKV